MGQNMNNRLRIVAAMAVLNDGGKASDILAFTSAGEQDALKTAMDSNLAIDAADREFKLKGAISAMVASDRWSGLAEIHPAWLLEELKHESPRIIGIILRYLPSRHVRWLLENLPPAVRFAIPNIIEAFSVPQPVLDVIRTRFESRFATIRVSRSPESFGFEQLYYLRGDELEALFRDLGLQELAMALHGLSGKSLTYLYNRLSLKDAKKLQNRIKSMEHVSDALKRQSRFTVLEVEGENLGPDNLLMEIGLAAFARAVSKDHEELSRLIEIKLDPRISYVLKRYIDERADKNTRAAAEERRTIILSRVASLARENLIDESWGRFFQD
jgi:hypothetical protein